METTGQRRTKNGTKLYGENPITIIERNEVQRIRFDIAGGRPRYEALPTARRDEIRRLARELYDAGAQLELIAAPVEEKTKKGFVYVIDHPALQGVKVGRAYNPESRLRGYQTGCPRRAYRLRYADYFEDCHVAETAIHARLNAHQLEGEWFDIAPDEALETIEAYARSITHQLENNS